MTPISSPFPCGCPRRARWRCVKQRAIDQPSAGCDMRARWTMVSSRLKIQSKLAPFPDPSMTIPQRHRICFSNIRSPGLPCQTRNRRTRTAGEWVLLIPTPPNATPTSNDHPSRLRPLHRQLLCLILGAEVQSIKPPGHNPQNALSSASSSSKRWSKLSVLPIKPCRRVSATVNVSSPVSNLSGPSATHSEVEW